VAAVPGVHVMATPTDHAVETLTGLGGTGVQLVLAHVQGPPLQGHPMIPLVQVTTDSKTARMFHKDLDRVIEPEKLGPAEISEQLLHLVCDTASHTYQPKLWTQGNTDFQVTRGYLGVSL
jgi:altronate dehydratase